MLYVDRVPATEEELDRCCRDHPSDSNPLFVAALHPDARPRARTVIYVRPRQPSASDGVMMAQRWREESGDRCPPPAAAGSNVMFH